MKSVDRVYFGRDLVLARCPIDYKKGDRVGSIGKGREVVMTMPADFRAGDELLASRTDGKIWAARRNGIVFWFNEDEPFTVALVVPQKIETFAEFWRGLDQ